jgi:molybdate transport system substrate-binding protein
MNNLNRFAFLILLAALMLTACGSPAAPALLPTATSIPPTAVPGPRTLTVFAAASLTDAFTEMGHNFEAANPGVTVALNFAGSQTLSTQIQQGAVADVFASANHTEMDKLVNSGLVGQDAPKDFLTNRLVVILPAGNPANIQTLLDLARPGLKLVLAADTVPVGKYARQILTILSQDAAYGADFQTRVLANVVSNENDVKLVVAKVQLGEADAGIAYISDAIAAPQLLTIEIPANFNIVARYPIAVLVNAPHPGLAAGFITYILSSGGQAILKKWGFTPVAP